MKSVLVLCLMIIVISFTFATVIGVVCASIDIIRSPKRYKITPSADVVDDTEDHIIDQCVASDDVVVEDKRRIIS